MREIDIYQVDAFTDVIFGGNPAGVVPDASSLDEETMQKIAREMNLSETAFVVDTRAQGPADFDVRFFTPVSEVDLCGHATIGTFWLLAEMGIIALGQGKTRVRQRTRAGILPVDIYADASGRPARVMMTQNLPEVKCELPLADAVELERILDAPSGCITGFRQSRPQVVSTGLPDLIVPVTSRRELLAMRPNMAKLSEFCKERGVISVHCFSLDPVNPGATVHCRDFSPAVGVPEESATGTASGATGAYLVLNRLVRIEEPVTRIVCEQGHILKRPSTIFVEIEVRDGRVACVRVGGQAVTVLRGKMLVG